MLFFLFEKNDTFVFLIIKCLIKKNYQTIYINIEKCENARYVMMSIDDQIKLKFLERAFCRRRDQFKAM